MVQVRSCGGGDRLLLGVAELVQQLVDRGLLEVEREPSSDDGMDIRRKCFAAMSAAVDESQRVRATV
ncbi:MAG: hypothetical protein H6816_16120, partial [Phycisphaerales bacterium]|nr:hypothetical protein [Phycisphaerales bacterium]